MRGRYPRPLTLDPEDVPILRALARSWTRSGFQIERARILLGVAHGQRVQTLAFQMQCDPATVWRACRDYERRGLDAVLWEADRPGRPQQLSPLQRARIVQLACLEPVATGLHVTHWSSEDLARQAVAAGIVEAIAPRTVRQILHDVDLQPHRTRYWKTSRLDATFKDRAEKVLWCYANARNLAARGVWVVCVDEIPNFQILERRPIRRAIPESIEHQEFEYTRHGTTNLLAFLVVHTGRMELAVEAKKDADHYARALSAFRRHRGLNGVFLIQDGDPSHTASATRKYWSQARPWWRPRFTPAHASWLNQAELLVHAFGDRYLKRTSWAARDDFLAHLGFAVPEYNERYAHAFEWYWTNRQMREWFAQHAHE